MWSRRNILAICAIIALAVAIVVVTALIAGGGSQSTASTNPTSEPPPPNLDSMLLNRNALSGIMGNIPLDVEWAAQLTINLARDPELLDLAARSGARVLSIGFESLSQESLETIGKGFNRASRFREDIARLRARGIQVIALIMVGLDGDTPEGFAGILRWLEENHIAFLKLFTPAPYPGTRYHADMTAEGRILLDDWGRYDYGSAIVRPRNMTPEQMLDGFRAVYRGFYSVRSMLRRFVPPPRKNLLESLAMLVANAKVTGYLRRNPEAWGTIS